MSIWQITVLSLCVVAGCAVIGCLWGICRAIEKLARNLFTVVAELTKINAKLERIEAVNGDDNSLESLEAAFANFEKLKRIDSRP